MAKNFATFPIFALQNIICAMKTVILAMILLFMALLALGVRVLFVKGGKFPSGHVESIPELRRRGIKCASHESKQN